MHEPLERMVADVLAAPKYRHLCADTVRRIAAQSLARHKTLAQATQATKSKLHQVYAAYEAAIDYTQALDELRSAHQLADPSAFKTVCHRLLSLHASTRERLPILDTFFERLFAHTGQPSSLLDLACGLGPLALPWMNLAPAATYHAYDIDQRRVEFLNRFFELTDAHGQAHLHDILGRLPAEKADVALLLKASTCLEQQEKASTLNLIENLDVSHIIVTYPVQSLGKRPKGMVEHYAQAFTAITANRPWRITRLDFATELAFIVSKQDVAHPICGRHTDR